MQKHVNLVDLVKSFPTNIYLQNLASIQKRTSPVKYAHLAEKLGKGSISNLSTKADPAARQGPGGRHAGLGPLAMLAAVQRDPVLPTESGHPPMPVDILARLKVASEANVASEACCRWWTS